jgi:hypothetical protein
LLAPHDNNNDNYNNVDNKKDLVWFMNNMSLTHSCLRRRVGVPTNTVVAVEVAAANANSWGKGKKQWTIKKQKNGGKEDQISVAAAAGGQWSHAAMVMATRQQWRWRQWLQLRQLRLRWQPRQRQRAMAEMRSMALLMTAATAEVRAMVAAMTAVRAAVLGMTAMRAMGWICWQDEPIHRLLSMAQWGVQHNEIHPHNRVGRVWDQNAQAQHGNVHATSWLEEVLHDLEQGLRRRFWDASQVVLGKVIA